MRLTLSALITSMMALMLFVASGQGLLSGHSFSQVIEEVDVVANNRVPSFILLGQLNASLGDVRIAQSGLIAAPAEQVPAFQQALEKATTAVKVGMDKYEALLVDKADKDLFASFKSKWIENQGYWSQVAAFIKDGKAAEAKALFFGKAQESYDSMGDVVQSAVDDMASDTNNESAAALDAANLGSELTYVALGIAMLIGVLSIVFSKILVSRPLRQITAAMQRLTHGELDLVIPGAGRRDEVGDMAEALEVFKQAAITNKRLEREAAENREKAEADRIATQERAEAAAAERLRIATSGLAGGLKQLAAGDLSFQLNEPFSPDFEALRHDFNQSVEQLGSAMSAVMSSVTTMENGAQEIASNVNDLSKRTEKQAASLEETAAAVEEITSNVQSSTKRTDEARRVTGQANGSAGQSADVVGRAEDAMRRIEESSEQISNIIGVIDEIAFQTNLLALNAGVEAARAGEAGKGFAVVAQEVRELAQRSAKAAKEIKELIQKSSSEVESGVTLVRGAGDALKTIGSFIAGINDHMEAIAQSAKEQATGLTEVNQAVNSMDQMTQQNAAMVEESSAAANTLAGEARRLKELLSHFRLQRGASNQVAALRQTARHMAAPAASRASAPQPRAAAASGGASSWEEF